jgi:uracil-DNA glycosylase family 4
MSLDARQRAMLQEMGVRVFAPEPLPQLPGEAPSRVLSAPMPARGDPLAPAARTTQPQPHHRLQEQPQRQPGIQGVHVPRQPGALGALDWQSLAVAAAGCETCAACPQPGGTVFGVGDPQPDWLIIGDPPDEGEMRAQEPFVGEPGQLLNNMLKALGLTRTARVFLTPVMKCRPPQNRNPTRDEIAQCEPLLRRQVELLRPKVILVMGRFAVPALLGTSEPIGKLRGRLHDYAGVPVVVTYHPAYLLRNLPDKARAWADLCLAREVVDSARAAA